jgi:hypothetical protein
MSLNLVSYRQPSFICGSEACPAGLGGNGHLGNLWHFVIPEDYHYAGKYHNNSLEFLALLWRGKRLLTSKQPMKNAF